MEIKDPYLYEERVLDRLRRELKKYGKLIIAYDFDYTINSYRNETWEYPEVIQLLKDWKDKAYFICYTASPEERYEEIRSKTKELGVPLDYINENVQGVNVPSRGKMYYNILLDDRSGLSECVRVLRKLIEENKKEDNKGMKIVSERKCVEYEYNSVEERAKHIDIMEEKGYSTMNLDWGVKNGKYIYMAEYIEGELPDIDDIY